MNKKLLILITLLASFSFASAADFLSFQLASTTLSNGNILQTNGRNSIWVAPSVLGFITGAYASSTFVSFPYATTTFSTYAYGTSTYALLSSLASYITFPYASSTFPSFSYASTTYAVGGSNTQVQFNDNGVFGGDAGFLWTKGADTLTLGVEAGDGLIVGATAVSANTNGGNLQLFGGDKTGAGIPGIVFIQGGSNSDNGVYIGGSVKNAIFDTSLLASTDKTFTFPNTTGTFCLTITCITTGYASSTFVTYPYATTTFSTYAYGTSTYASTTGLVSYYVPYTGANANVNLGANNITFANGSSTNLSASTGIFAGALNVSGASFLQGNASSSKLSAWGFTFGNAIGTGTLAVLGNSSTTNTSAYGFTAANIQATGTLSVLGNSSTTNTSAYGFTAQNIQATGTLNVIGNASTTKLSAWGFTFGNAIGTGTLAVLGNSSTTNLSAYGFTAQNIQATGTLNVLGNASTTNTSTYGLTFQNGQATGTLDVLGKFTGTTASTTQISASTGATFANLYAPNAFFTQATSTNLNLAGWFRDSVNATGTSGQILQSTGTSTLWQTFTSITNSYASSTFVTYPYASSTFPTIATLLDFSTHNLTATGTLNVTGLATFGNASTTNISASTGATLAALNVPGTSLLTGKTTMGTASSTIFSASTGATIQALNVPGNTVMGGTLDVTGKTTLANASTTQISASTGAWLANIWDNALLNVVGTSTLATTTATALRIGTTTPSYWSNVGQGTSQETATIVSGTTTTGLAIWGNVNDFFQSVVTNLGQGVNTESCFVTQNASSTATTNFGSFCQNGPQFATTTSYNTGKANDITFIGSGNDMYFSNTNVSKNIFFQIGTGTSTASTTKMTLSNLGFLGLGSTTPNSQLVVSGGSIVVTPQILSTSTSMQINFATTSNTLVMPISTSAITVTFVGLIPGQTKMIQVINPPTGTAGAITWSQCGYSGGTAPTQTTTANKYDWWSVKVGNATTSPYTGTPVVACNISSNY